VPDILHCRQYSRRWHIVQRAPSPASQLSNHQGQTLVQQQLSDFIAHSDLISPLTVLLRLLKPPMHEWLAVREECKIVARVLFWQTDSNSSITSKEGEVHLRRKPGQLLCLQLPQRLQQQRRKGREYHLLKQGHRSRLRLGGESHWADHQHLRLTGMR
jgi:hypothetical protein